MPRASHATSRASHRILFTCLSALLALAAGSAGCKGPPGDAGPAGSAGVRGPEGSKGADGQSGANGTNGTNGTDGMPGKDGKDGTSATVDPSLSPQEKALVAIGGKDALAKMSSYSYTSKGSRGIDAEGYMPEEVRTGSTFELKVQADLVEDNLRIDNNRTAYLLGPMQQTFTEYVRGNLGHVDGMESVFGVVTGDMTSSRWASTRRQQEFLNPHLILRKIVADPSLVIDESGVALLDGSLHHLVVVDEHIHPITLYVNAQTGLISKTVTVENDYLLRDSLLQAHYIGWQPAAGGVLYPQQVAISLGESVVHNEVRDSFEANVAIDPKVFEFPAAANPTFDDADAHRGEQSHQHHQVWSSVGIPSDTIQSIVLPTELAPGVFHVTGGTHHSLAIEQENGIVLVDAPLYEERSEAILAWVAQQFPAKPVSHLIISHHHRDHSAGARTVVAKGAEVVVGEATAPFFRDVFLAPSTIKPDALATAPTKAVINDVPLGSSFTIADATRPVTAYHVKNAHAADLLMIHVENEKILFIVDIYSPGTPAVPQNVQDLYDAITKEFGIAVDLIAGGHGATATFEDFVKLVPTP